MTRILVLFFVLLASVAHAQTKPIGLFGVSCEDRPAWASFGHLAEWDDFARAAECSRQTGMQWAVFLFDAERAHVDAVRTRAHLTGLAPHVLALAYREEPYQHLRLGLDPPPTLQDALQAAHGADMVTRLHMVRDHWSAAHGAIRAAWPGPHIAFITPWVNDSLAFGEPLYSPLPSGAGVLVLDPYAMDSQRFADWPEIVIQYAVNTTTLPIALVPQWFTQPGTTIATPRDFAADYRRWLRHPRIVALWGFLWASRPGLVGLRDLPALRSSVELTLGVR